MTVGQHCHQLAVIFDHERHSTGIFFIDDLTLLTEVLRFGNFS